MNTLETLKAARQLISDPTHWTQGWYARNKSGEEVGATSPAACSWCLVGAFCHVGDESNAISLLGLELDKNSPGLGDFNDYHSHSEVLDLFDKAIAKLELLNT